MKNYYLKSFMLLTAGFLASCDSSDRKTAAEEIAAGKESTTTEEACTYSLPTPDSTVVAWTAYKTTDKVGVGGTFTEFELSGLEEASTIEEAIANASISIPIASIFTKNPERDERIKTYFFGVMDETTELVGTVKEVANGEGTFTLTMNSIEANLPFTYTVEDDMLTLKATMDVEGWNAQAAIDALNEECKDLHAGADGVTKLWSEVALVIKSPVTTSCN